MGSRIVTHGQRRRFGHRHAVRYTAMLQFVPQTTIHHNVSRFTVLCYPVRRFPDCRCPVRFILSAATLAVAALVTLGLVIAASVLLVTIIAVLLLLLFFFFQLPNFLLLQLPSFFLFHPEATPLLEKRLLKQCHHSWPLRRPQLSHNRLHIDVAGKIVTIIITTIAAAAAAAVVSTSAAAHLFPLMHERLRVLTRHRRCAYGLDL
ncbi:hypothetical protein B0J12DRAFT_37201 [Macrophomina phaseolina]|uniref:Uncharacterized protein n=1 Tax=Macrophomina phaseolina TaxID=35725 RepID=A0ABQ8GZ16_9PEZI|nr:hypothetical protein B0J12DRAFT_37201 [Macrophomina phaseolina]